MKTKSHIRRESLSSIRFMILVVAISFSSASMAQSDLNHSDNLASITETSTTVESTSAMVMPLFETAEYKDINAYFSDALEFPESGIEMGKSGMMKVQFQIKTDGSISHIQYIESPGAEFEKQVSHALMNAPKWIPAHKHAKPVQTTYQLHINFALY